MKSPLNLELPAGRCPISLSCNLCRYWECLLWCVFNFPNQNGIVGLSLEEEAPFCLRKGPGELLMDEGPRKLSLDLRQARREAQLTSGQHM